MNEGKRKEEHKAVRTLSYIALIAGISTFLLILVCFPLTLWLIIGLRPKTPEAENIARFLLAFTYETIIWFWFIATPALIISIVTLLKERNKCLRILPLAFVLAGILLYKVCHSVLYASMK